MYTLKQARLLSGLTQQELAEKMGVHKGTYRRIEQFPDKATIEQAKKISQITSIGINDIFFARESTFGRDKQLQNTG